jgi:hypothetical protein
MVEMIVPNKLDQREQGEPAMATEGHKKPCGACKRGFREDDPGHLVQHVTAPEGGYNAKTEADQIEMTKQGWPFGGFTVCVDCYAKINPNVLKLPHAAHLASK